MRAWLRALRTESGFLRDDVKVLSNCIVQSFRMRRLVRKLRADGGLTGPGWEVYGWWRQSRARNGAIHVGLGILDGNTDQLRLLSWKPKAPVDVPWYLAWKRLAFEGEWRWGDFPDTQPFVKPLLP